MAFLLTNHFSLFTKRIMDTLNNKTLEKLKYELVRDGVVSYETLEKAEELENVQRINIG